jgi:catechol 2,3-dioxygenase-like lactoylglutathione lyase family enzyme
VEYGVVHFDHLMHWVPDLDAAVRDYQALGFTVQRAGQHPQFGTHNAGWRLDARYIELIAVRDEAVARAGLGPDWPEIDATLRAGGGVGGFGVLVTDITATVANLRSRGIPVSDPQSGSIQRTDGSIGVWQGASLQDGPRWAPFFINYGLPIDEWAARFRDQGFPKDPWVLQGVTVEVPDPSANASWLADVFGLDVLRIGQDAAQVPLPGCAITFASGPADRITAVVLNGIGARRLRELTAGDVHQARNRCSRCAGSRWLGRWIELE